MASQYDKFDNVKDLLVEVRMRGFSTKQEDVIRAQDIFGHSTEDELAELANDNGRRDGFNGKPDPRGSFSSGHEGLSKYFYQVLFSIWNWEDATRFYNLHSNFPLIDAMKERTELKERIKVLNDELTKVKADREQEHKNHREAVSAELAAQKRIDLLEAEAHYRDMEIMELKAKLYDMMMEGK